MIKYAITAIAWIFFLVNAHLCHGLAIGDAAKDFALKDAGGGMVTLRSLMQGADATVLEFLSIYCDACKKKVPQLNGLAQKYTARRLRIVAIALANEQPEVTAAMNEWGVTYSFLADPEKSTFYLYAIHKVPRFFIIDRAGIIRYSGNADDFADFEKTIENVLAQPAAPKTLQPGDAAPPLKSSDERSKAATTTAEEEQSAASAGQQIMEALKQAMPDARSIDPVRLPEATIYIGTDAEGKKTYARLVKKDILCEVCTDVEFIETIDPNEQYRSLVLVKPFEVYGKQVDTTKFLQQFIGRSYHQKVVAGSNADIISGATKSSLKLIEGLNETERVFADCLSDPAFDATFKQSVCFQNQAELELALHLYQREHQATAGGNIPVKNLASYCPEGKLPRCPSAGAEYRVATLNGIPRVLCTVHGMDPQSSIIH
jgi:peroxiredoxin